MRTYSKPDTRILKDESLSAVTQADSADCVPNSESLSAVNKDTTSPEFQKVAIHANPSAIDSLESTVNNN